MSEFEELADLIRERIQSTRALLQLSGDPDGLGAAALEADMRFLNAVEGPKS